MDKVYRFTVLCLLLLTGMARAEIETITYLHNDHLGSPVLARDSQGNTLWREDYSPWGERLIRPSGNSADIGYTGHYEETDIGLTYAQARWYDPQVGRFLATDAVDFTGGGTAHFNRYRYAGNNPVYYVDPSGNAEIAASANGYHVSLITRDEKVQAQFYKLFKRTMPVGIKRLNKAAGIGEEAGKAITMGAFVGPNSDADPRTVLDVDDIFSQYLKDNTDAGSADPYSRQEVEKAYSAAANENESFADDFKSSHPSIDKMLDGARKNYNDSVAGQNDRGIKRFINPGHESR